MALAMEIDKVASIDLAELAAGYDAKRRMDPADFLRLLECIFHYGKVAGRVLEIGLHEEKKTKKEVAQDEYRRGKMVQSYV